MKDESSITRNQEAKVESNILMIRAALLAIEADNAQMTSRGNDPPICYLFIDFFNFCDALVVINKCVPNFVRLSEWENERDELLTLIHSLISTKFPNKEHLMLIELNLKKRIQEFGNYVTALPKNVSPSGDGFWNILSMRQSIEALLDCLHREIEIDPLVKMLKTYDEMLKVRANLEWWGTRKSSCEYQLLEMHPLSRWWFYSESYYWEKGD